MRRREQISDWLILAGAAALLLSLFLSWSHQLPAHFVARQSGNAVLRGIPRDPTAWQVYSAADVALALVAGALVLAALGGGRLFRLGTLIGAVLALAFTVHAVSVPPTNGAATLVGLGYVSGSATSGPGEVMALVALVAAILGLLVSFTAD